MLCFIATASLLPQTQLPFLSPVFGSHMVLQRDRPNTFWGWTSPGAKVTVTIGDHRGGATADAAGKWMARVSPPAVGGPYTVSVDGSEHVKLDDILVGDVYVCSGQSNMEMGISMVNNAQAEIANANFPGIRLFMVQHEVSATPVQVPTGFWAVCSPQSVASGGWGGFSAAAYFFGRELHEKMKIPIGLVQTCWGGTIAEAWTSRPGLKTFPEFAPAIQKLQDMAAGETTGQRLDKWYRTMDSGSSQGDAWAKSDFNDSDWKPAPITKYEDLGLSKFDGVVWFRKEVILPDTLPSGSVLLQLGTVDDIDTTWVNGVRVGESYSYGDARQYRVAANVFKPGRNVITVRVLDTGGPGGLMTAQNQWMAFSGGQPIALSEGWRYMQGGELKASNPVPILFSDNPNIPTVLYNGMIAPILPLAIRGTIWYQGESNAGRAKQYERLLPAMIGDWRRSWNQGDFPFFIVQLANFSTRHPEPVEDAWAELREAQTLTATHVRNAGMAVAIDIGDGADIHPKDKQSVGHRLALAARHIVYKEDLTFSGPVLRSSEHEGRAIRLRFDHADGGLDSRGPKLAGFQIAGRDHKFHWADAKIDGNTVLVSSPDVPEPLMVRYAWDTNPEATLYNKAGLPAVPFRTDR